LTKTRFVIFDLDNTLVDSNHIKPIRDRRQWTEVYSLVPTLKLFPGIRAVWKALQVMHFHLAVVTHSPRTYAERVLRHLHLDDLDCLIAYHDLAHRKPSPDGYHKACVKLERGVEGLVVGDEPADLYAADAFGCDGYFAGWSRNPRLTRAECEKAGWYYVDSPKTLLDAAKSL